MFIKKGKIIKIVMVGPDVSVKGGICTVAKQYLYWDKWKNVKIIYVPVHIEKTLLYKGVFFLLGFIRICFLCFLRKADIVHLHMAERGSFYRE